MSASLNMNYMETKPSHVTDMVNGDHHPVVQVSVQLLHEL